MHRFLVRIFFIAAVFSAPAVCLAAPRDNAANQKIEEAVNTHYLATEFDKAEGLLKGVIEACEDRCSPPVKARAWMYIGVVRGSGRQDITGAQEAFQQALALDPNVKLDDALATPPVRQAFVSAAAALGQGTPEPPPSKPSGGTPPEEGATPAADVPGTMECTPDVTEVESQRAIPVACTTDEPAVKVTLRYMAFGAGQWAQVAMTRKGETWQGEIPCSDTSVLGKLKFYVQAKDKDGEELDNFGNKKQPSEIQVVSKTDQEPPSYPGQQPPPRCMSASECPEDMIGTPACPGSKGGRGNKGWGAPCDTSRECEAGLLCTQGDSGRTCETAPSCENDGDCPGGSICKSGTCDLEGGGEDTGGAAAGGPFKKNWLGLHFGWDFAFLSGENVCAAGSDFDCYYAGDIPVRKQYILPQYGGTLTGGAAPATMRLMASYERLFSQHLGAEARLGFAFNGGPKAPNGGAAFLPIHIELRGKYWFLKDSFSRKGIRPYVHLGGGMAQVDAKLTVRAYDCDFQPQNFVDPNADENLAAGCVGAGGADPDGPPATPPSAHGAMPYLMTAYRKLGQGFITGGLGAMYAIKPNHGVVLNLNAMYMVPASGLVLEPSIGYSLGL